MIETQNIQEEGEKKDPNQKELISLKLFDKLNPEMITKVSLKDVDNLSTLLTLTQDENIYRANLRTKGYDIEDSLFNKVIIQNLVLRTSLDGWRSEQAVKMVTAVLDDDKKDPMNNFSDKLRGLIGR